MSFLEAGDTSNPKKRSSSLSSDGSVSRRRLSFADIVSPGSRLSTEFKNPEMLGIGGYAYVYRCTHKLDGARYAVKMIPFAENETDKVLREVKILAAYHHPSIVRYHQCWIEDSLPVPSRGSVDMQLLSGKSKTLYAVMECCSKTMQSAIEDGIVDTDVLRYLKELLEGLRFLHEHENGVIHGDISNENVFVDEHGHAKLGDFGMARYGGEGPISLGPNSCGNEMYQAPENSKDCLFISKKGDMYALGLLLLEMSMSYEVKTTSERNEMFAKVKRDPQVLVGKIPESVQQMIESLLNPDPQQRLSAANFLDKYFQA